jgi:hypothetical protein
VGGQLSHGSLYGDIFHVQSIANSKKVIGDASVFIDVIVAVEEL